MYVCMFVTDKKEKKEDYKITADTSELLKILLFVDKIGSTTPGQPTFPVVEIPPIHLLSLIHSWRKFLDFFVIPAAIVFMELPISVLIQFISRQKLFIGTLIVVKDEK